MTHAWRPCMIPFCTGHDWADERTTIPVCAGHRAVVTQRHDTLEVWMLDATVSGLAGLPTVGDEGRARLRANMRKKREARLS